MPWIAGLHLVWSLESAIQLIWVRFCLLFFRLNSRQFVLTRVNSRLVFLHVFQWLMSCFGFTQHHAKAASAKTESLFDAPSHRHSAAVAGYTKILADHPHAARAVINLK